MNSEYLLVLGAATSLMMTELIGISPGGVIVPGFFALYLDSPARLFVTLLDAALALLAVRFLGRYAILFGRRRYASFLFAGFISRYLLERLIPGLAPEFPVIAAVGWLVPGILAAEADRQGPIRTLLALAGACAALRLAWAALG